ncbi:type II secretion system protein [Psychrobacillus glaciei]|uniref:Type II secretion system protein n=1 Tax=Psychrobacillus glaciei TaxID=2283160 RepID=A0A5J6SNT2_9BACI|nr:type II secretion system protein [Psychrobacillus glaciei]QFF99575.1 type II secretion system protein [Psychrobacillus glaciei]
MFLKHKNTNGFTLIEILASIVLLTVIISMFLTMFPQMANMNNRTGDNLDAANVGKELLVIIKKNNYNNFSNNTNLAIKEKIHTISINKSNNDYLLLKDTYKSFFIEIKIYNSKVFPDNSTNQLYKVSIEVKKNEASPTPLTTTYGYIKGN